MEKILDEELAREDTKDEAAKFEQDADDQDGGDGEMSEDSADLSEEDELTGERAELRDLVEKLHRFAK